MISRLLGIELPGRGTNWMKQELTFYAAAKLGEPITASVEIVRLRPDKDLVNLRTTCTVGGRLICEGEALVMAREML
jgi:3-hydroxybutyryl-CoA dehydratase